jgi:hypothetical protein
MNKLTKFAIAAIASLSLGVAALAHADEVATPGSEKQCDGKDGKGRHGFRHGGPKSAEWRAKKNAMLNSLTSAELKQVGLTDEQVKAFEAAKPFTERGQLRKLAIMDRTQMKQLRQIMKARFQAEGTTQTQ